MPLCAILDLLDWISLWNFAEQQYMSDKIGKRIVNAVFLLQISYAIGISHPLSVSVFHYGTSTREEDELLEIVKNNFDLRPGVIVK